MVIILQPQPLHIFIHPQKPTHFQTTQNPLFFAYDRYHLKITMVKIIQNYTLHQQIGQGQYGKVYRGVDGRNGKEVAVKVINVKRFKDNPKLQECTLNQIEVLTKIDSPYIVRFIEILKTINNFYFFYQFCNGGTLDQEIRKNGCLPESKIIEYLEQLIEAFKILTANNIMHRDLKPSNILMHNGRIKLGDFGFCKSLENQRDLAQTMLGSPIYMAPEVLRGEIYTIKADIWSLGVVVYEMAFGFCPFQESSIARLINVLEYQQLQFNKEINNISPQLEELMKLILVKDHFKRISWDDLFSYSLKGGKINKNGGVHHRVLSETNRIMKKDTMTSYEKENKPVVEAKFMKKKSQYDEEVKSSMEDIHQNLKEIVKIIDRAIQQNANPQLTCIVTLRLYRLVLKVHNKLGTKKEYLKERVELNDAISAISTLIEDEDKKNQLLDSSKGPSFSSFSNFLKTTENEEVNSITLNAKQLEKCLLQANLIRKQ